MPQIFHRSMNTFSKVSIFGAVFFAAGLIGVGYFLERSPWSTGVGYAREQPVQFSHRHHVGDDGIDCRYCHTSVEDSSFAGIPTTQICMNCHSQIWNQSPYLAPVRESYRTGQPLQWVRVHELPDFVYFNHSIHVAKGVGCVTCHGRVDQMNLTYKVASLQMEWCLECHFHPEKYVRPREQVFNLTWQPNEDQVTLGNRLVQEYSINRSILANCDTCHR